MAITAQKLLGSSSIIKSNRSSLAPTGGGALIRVEKKVIKINNLVKNNLLLQKKGGQLAIREKENADLEKKEKDLEKQKPTGLNGIKMPKLPGFGFMGWIKNWIFKTLLGFITVRLIDYLPKMLNFVSIAGPAMGGILNFSGMLLNGMVSFVDAGYKAVDATRGLVGKTFGEDALKNFDKLAGDFEKFMNLAIIVGMASAGFGMDRLGKKGAKKAAEKGAGTLARRGASRVATRAGARLAGKSGAKLATKIGSKALKAIPLLGAGLAIAEGIMRIKDGDYVGGLLSFGSAIPVAGWAFLALDIAREFGAFGETKFAGGGYVARPKKYAGGGATPPARRKVSKVKRKVSAKAPITKVKPGASVGGKQNIVKIFPENKNKSKQTNPLGYLEGSATSLGKAPNFGPLFTIAMKTILGDKPTAQDYKNAGIGLNSWMSNKITNVGGFAGGGEVDGRMLFAGKDMSDAIASSIQNSVSNDINRTIDDLMKQLMLKGIEPKKPSGSGTGPGDTGSEGMQLNGNLASKSVQLSKRLQQMFGLKDFQAAAIVGTWLREGFGSGFPDIKEGGKRGAPTYNAPRTGGYGFAQWTNTQGGGPNDRLNRAMIYLGMKDNPRPWTVDDNLKVFKWEIEQKGYGTAISELKKTTNLTDAVRTFVGIYEAGGMRNIAKYEGQEGGGFIDRRVSSAKGVLKYMTSGKDDQGKTLETASFSNPNPTLGTMSGSLSDAKSLAESMGVPLYSHIRKDNPNSYHYDGRAMDFSNDGVGNGTPQQLALAKEFVKKYGATAKEIFYTPLGFGIRNGKSVSLADLGPKLNKQHYNHVHVAFAAGGRVSKPTFALIGEKGQEFVFDADTTKGMDQMMPGLLEHLNAAKTKPQLASILSSYSDDPGMILIPPASSSPPAGGRSGGGGSTSSGSVNRQDNSWMFDRLATGTG